MDFEVINADEFHRSAPKKSRSRDKTEPRNSTTWYDLNHSIGYCTVPLHDEIVQMLNPEQKSYRQIYPVRMIYRIGEYDVCRDCFLSEADKDASV